MKRRTAAALMTIGAVATAGAPVAQAQDDPGAGTQIGGSVPSFMSLSLTVDDAAKTVLAAVTSTDAPTTLSVADAAIFDPFSDPLIALWTAPVAGATRTIRATAGRTILITVSSESP